MQGGCYKCINSLFISHALIYLLLYIHFAATVTVTEVETNDDIT